MHNHSAPRDHLLARNDLVRKAPLEDREMRGRGLGAVDKITRDKMDEILAFVLYMIFALHSSGRLSYVLL